MLASIITPSFRQLQWLKLCVASVADQEGASQEHIVQDAGTGPELEAWAQSIPKLALYVEKDSGMYDAINRGLRRVSGEICSYLNSDEQLLPGALLRVASFFNAHPDVDVVFGDAILIDDRGNPLAYRRTVLPKLSHVHYAHLNTPTCATFFRRSLLNRGFFFDPEWKVIGDQVWIESLLLAGIRMATLREPLAVFTFTGQNLGSTKASEEEAIRRRGGKSFAAGFRKAGAVISHRVRKLLAGAYKRRKIDIEIYTLDSLNARQRKHAEEIGFSWPNQ
jgi:glycosyltransferase involved in cell wall biosynthesis